ncbi:unnamed protein product [Zymoseptoria tritici ST99CH_1E4]|uniref:ABC transporter n=1 Tax=Zymoseptoria tritici ST99CH_1E4 TaxID=1276532 RepID=A0A2H1GLL7_ZYMTR|nr:unnamed protein product [Zymoseptoria tritici ST99CH_1E4]
MHLSARGSSASASPLASTDASTIETVHGSVDIKVVGTCHAHTSLPLATIGVLEAVAIAVVSGFEHFKSKTPSLLLNGFLLLSLVLGIPVARIYWLRPGFQIIAAAYTVLLAIKALLLIVEELPKRHAAAGDHPGVESNSGILSRSAFWWLNPLLLKGARSILSVDTISSIGPKFSSQRLKNKLEHYWNLYDRKDEYALLKCTFLAYKGQFVAGVPARICSSAFNFAQPFLIHSLVDFVGQPSDQRSRSAANGLIAATILVYLGLAISNGCYRHMTYQLLTMCRGGLAPLIFGKMLRLQSSKIESAAPVTLMSTDIEGIMLSGNAPAHTRPDRCLFTYFIQDIAGHGTARSRWSEAIQKRIAAASGILSHIKSIKITGSCQLFHDHLQNLKRSELKLSLAWRRIWIGVNILATLAEDLTPVLVMLATILWSKAGQDLTFAEAFTILAVINLTITPLNHMLTLPSQIASVMGCFRRLQSFLRLEEDHSMSEHRLRRPLLKPHNATDSRVQGFEMQIPTFCDDRPCLGMTDQEYSPPGSNIAIALEHASFSGSDGRIVLEDCNLLFERGSLSMIVGPTGSGKSSLLKAIAGDMTNTSGQVMVDCRAIALCEQEPWLQNVSIRDNIIGKSAPDEAWLDVVLQACALKADIAALSNHQFTIAGSGGIALSGGQKKRVALARAVYSRCPLLLLDDILSGLDRTTTDEILEALLGPSGLLRHTGITIVMATSSVEHLEFADRITVLHEGHVSKGQVTLDRIDPATQRTIPHETARKAASSGGYGQHASQSSEARPIMIRDNNTDFKRQAGAAEYWKVYLRSVGAFGAGALLIITSLHTVFAKLPQIWLLSWTKEGTRNHDGYHITVYIALAFASSATFTADLIYFLLITVPRSSKNLHGLLVTSVLRAPLSFHTSTDSGTILNRFSQDMTLVDNALPMAALMAIVFAFRALAEVVIVASGASFAAIAIIPSVAALYFVQKYYLRTSRQMRLLDLETKSPLYTLFKETLAGLATIRALGWDTAFVQDCEHRLDESQKPFYMMFCIQRWLQVVLDLFTAGVALVLVSLAVNTSDATSKVAIGLALVNLIGLSQTLVLVIDQWTRLETTLGAVARLDSFIKDSPDEDRSGEPRGSGLPDDWPSRGELEFENVTASYGEHAAGNAIRNICLRVQSGQKLGICGRSGSGKSSIVLAIAQMIQLNTGHIRLDGIDLATIDLQELRSRLIIVPQDPLVFSGTIRQNLVPYDRQAPSDDRIVEVLRKTLLWPVISSKGGLDAVMDDGFSTGHLQLLGLARALLAPGSIIILDEATSSVDQKTDEQVRALICDELIGRTVIEVAHKLEVIGGYDMVIVVDQGKVIELGNPRELLIKDDPSAFAALWRQAC